MLLALTQPWLVVSDLHVEPFDETPAAADYGSDTNWALFDQTVAQMRRTEPNPAVVVIAGDFLAHHFGQAVKAARPHESASAAAVATMARIESTFARAFPKAQFVITLGNNDDPCGDYSTGPNSAYLRSVAKMWAPLVNKRGAAPDFERDFAHAGRYIANLPLANVRAVVADSVFWSIVYRPCTATPVNPPAQQLAWLRRTLAVPGKRDVLVMHIPPGIDATSTLLTHRFIVVPFLRGPAAGQMNAAIAKNAPRIPLMIGGHLHISDFRIVGNVPLLIASSVSPIYDNNPSFLRLQMDSDGTLRDYQLIGYDLQNASWSTMFDFDDVFGVNSFTAQNLRIAHDRIARDTAVRERWAAASAADARGPRINRWNWLAYWCAQTESGGAYTSCAGDKRRAAVLPIGLALAGIAIIAGIIALVLRQASQRKRV